MIYKTTTKAKRDLFELPRSIIVNIRSSKLEELGIVGLKKKTDLLKDWSKEQEKLHLEHLKKGIKIYIERREEESTTISKELDYAVTWLKDRYDSIRTLIDKTLKYGIESLARGKFKLYNELQKALRTYIISTVMRSVEGSNLLRTMESKSLVIDDYTIIKHLNGIYAE